MTLRTPPLDPNAAGSSALPPRTALPGVVMTEYLVTPDGFATSVNPNKERWAITVRRLDPAADLWLVRSCNGAQVWTIHGKMAAANQFPPRELRHWCGMPLVKAHAKAVEVVATLRVDGLSLAEAEARLLAQAEQDRRRGERMDDERRRLERVLYRQAKRKSAGVVVAA